MQKKLVELFKTKRAHETGALVLAENAEPNFDNNDRSDDEQYYAAHPIASGLPTMRYASFFKTELAHETRALVLTKNTEPNFDNNDRSDDEQYYAEHPIASGLPTMRYK